MRLVIKGLVEPTVRLTAATIPHKLPHNLPSASHRFPFSLVKEQLPGATERFKSSLGHDFESRFDKANHLVRPWFAGFRRWSEVAPRYPKGDSDSPEVTPNAANLHARFCGPLRPSVGAPMGRAEPRRPVVAVPDAHRLVQATLMDSGARGRHNGALQKEHAHEHVVADRAGQLTRSNRHKASCP